MNLNKIQQGIDVTKPGTNQNPVPRTSAVPVQEEAVPATPSTPPGKQNAPKQPRGAAPQAKPNGSQVEQR